MRHKTHRPASEFAKIKVTTVLGGLEWVVFFHSIHDVADYAAPKMKAAAQGGDWFSISSIEPARK